MLWFKVNVGQPNCWNLRGKNITPKNFLQLKTKSFSRANLEHTLPIDCKPSRQAEMQHKSSANKIWFIRLLPMQHPAWSLLSSTYRSSIRYLKLLRPHYLSNAHNCASDEYYTNLVWSFKCVHLRLHFFQFLAMSLSRILYN